MVLPGVRTDPRTPGGMPDSGSVNPGGPMPSVPQATRQQNMGPGVGAPDPKKIEEIFTQYTAGQITREDLFNQLHAFSEGQGGILGLLEGLQQDPTQGSSTVPKPGGVLPGSPQGQGGAISPGAASVPIPPLKEPLDARHQKISTMLQGYGLGPADADQMSTILNPHTDLHRREWSDDEGLWMDMYDPDPEKPDAVTPPSGGIAYDPTVAGTGTGGEGLSGTGALEMRTRAGLGTTTGSRGVGALEGKIIGDKSLLLPDQQQVLQMESLRNMGQLTGQREAAYDEAAVQEQMRLQQLSYQQQREPEALGGTREEGLWSDPKTGRTYFNGKEIVKQPTVTPDPVIRGITDEPPSGETDEERLLREAQEQAGLGSALPETAEAKALRLEEEARQKRELEEKGLTEAELRSKREREAQNFVEGSEFNSFFGGAYNEALYTIEGSTTFGPSHRRAGQGIPANELTLRLPYYDDNTQTWFPSEHHYEEFTKWSDPEGENKFWGSPGVSPIFSHWEDKNGKEVPAGTPGAKGVAKHGTRITVTYEGKYGRMEEEEYHINTRGMTESDIAILKSNMQNSYWIPFDEEGNPLTGEAAYQPGWHPKTGSMAKLRLAPPVKPIDFTKTYNVNDELPDGWFFATDDEGLGVGNTVLYDEDGKFVAYADNEGNADIEIGAAPSTAGDGYDYKTDDGAASTGGVMDPLKPWIGDLDLKGGKYPMFQEFVESLQGGALTDAPFMTALQDNIGELEQLSETGFQAQLQRMAEITVNALDRQAVTLRAQLDRNLQQGVAMGKIGEDATLAAKIEEAKLAFQQAAISGLVPVISDDGTITAGSAKGIEAQRVDLTAEQQADIRARDLTSLFGQFVGDDDPTATMRTLEAQKFGLTKALAKADITGIIPTELGGTGFGQTKTQSAIRLAWEEDVARQNARTQQQSVQNAAESIKVDQQIANNRRILDEYLGKGNLAEAVEARKDSTFLAKQRLDLERDKMKLDTLTALANPATYLFAVRYGLLDQIGGALGISWGDDAITSQELPRMVTPGSFPSLTDFQNATPVEREIMLAEVASSGGFTTDEAVRRIIEGAPGGRDIRRTALVGVSR